MLWLMIGSNFYGLKTVLLPLSADECNSTEWALNSTYGSGTGMTSEPYNVSTVNQE